MISIIIALTCVRAQLYGPIATDKDSGDIVEFERGPSSVDGVDDLEFSIERIDDGAPGTGFEFYDLWLSLPNENSWRVYLLHIRWSLPPS